MSTRLRWLNPFFAEHHELRTELSPADCIDQLKASVVSRYSPRTWFWADAETPVFGHVADREFHFKRLHTFVRGWLLQEARGTIDPDGLGSSVLHVRIGLSPNNATLIGLQLLLTPVIALGAAIWFPHATDPIPRIVWLLLPALAYAPYVLDRLWWSEDDRFLLDFLRETIAPVPHHRLYEGRRTD